MLKIVYSRLSKDGKVKTQKEFGEQIDFASTAVTHMIKGNKPIPFRLVKKLYDLYEINANYIIAGDDSTPFYLSELYNKDQRDARAREETMKAQVNLLEKEVKDLKQRILDKEKIIQLLEKGK